MLVKTKLKKKKVIVDIDIYALEEGINRLILDSETDSLDFKVNLNESVLTFSIWKEEVSAVNDKKAIVFYIEEGLYGNSQTLKDIDEVISFVQNKIIFESDQNEYNVKFKQKLRYFIISQYIAGDIKNEEVFSSYSGRFALKAYISKHNQIDFGMRKDDNDSLDGLTCGEISKKYAKKLS